MTDEIPKEAVENVEKVLDEAIKDAPAQPAWSVVVGWTPESTREERDAAFEKIRSFVEDVTTSPAEHLPACITAVTVKRI